MKFSYSFVAVGVLAILALTAQADPPIPPIVTITAPKTGTKFTENDQILVYVKWSGQRLGSTIFMQYNAVNPSGVNGGQMTMVQQITAGETIFAPFRLPAGDYVIKSYSDDPNNIGDSVTITVLPAPPPGNPPPP